MRKLLSLLTVLTLTVPVPLNVIACGSKANPAPDTDDTDYLTLKKTAEDKIHTEFANLLNDGSNLKTEDNFTDGNEIMGCLKKLGQTEDKFITQETEEGKKTIDGFLEILKAQVLAISTNLVDKYPELKPLFNGVNPNERLKIKIDDFNKFLTNKVFKWENNDFDLQGFDAKDPKYGVTDWFHLTANLTLDLTCLGEDAKITTFSISQTYDMYFANKDSNLDAAVSAVTANIKEKLATIKYVELNYPQWNDSFANQENKVSEDIKRKLKEDTVLKDMPNLEINTKSIANPYNNDYNYMNSAGITDNNDHFPLTLPDSQNFIKDSKDFNDAWTPIIANRENNFVSRLNDWKAKYSIDITDEAKVFVFGEYQTINWKISGLEIKPLSIQYCITTKDITRAKNTSESLKILEKLFVGDQALFQFKKNYSNATDYSFIWIFNSDTYDDFTNRDVSIQKVYEYVTKQTNDFGTKNNFIKLADKVEWTTGGSTEWRNNKISSDNNYNDNKNWRLVINGNAFSMSTAKIKKGSTSFFWDITCRSSSNDVWPPLTN